MKYLEIYLENNTIVTYYGWRNTNTYRYTSNVSLSSPAISNLLYYQIITY